MGHEPSGNRCGGVESRVQFVYRIHAWCLFDSQVERLSRQLAALTGVQGETADRVQDSADTTLVCHEMASDHLGGTRTEGRNGALQYLRLTNQKV